jgi:GNAT superfamily N-acetyltransferase
MTLSFTWVVGCMPGVAVNIRRATIKDVDELVQLRCELWRAVQEPEPTPDLREATRRFFETRLGRDDFVTLVADVGDEIVAVGTVHLFERLPNAGNPSGREFYLVNLYTRPKYRRQGYAAELIRRFQDIARQRGARRIWLHASDAGRSVYERAGFTSKEGEMEYKW